MRHFYRHEIVSDELTMQAMQRLRFSKDLTRRVRRLVRYHMRPLECGASAVRRLLRDLEDDFDTWVTFKRADALGCKMSVEEIDQQLNIFNQMVEAERERVLRAQREKLAVTGHDLVALGMQPGPPMGEILSRMREMVLDDPDCNTKDHLLACAKQWIGHSSD